MKFYERLKKNGFNRTFYLFLGIVAFLITFFYLRDVPIFDIYWLLKLGIILGFSSIVSMIIMYIKDWFNGKAFFKKDSGTIILFSLALFLIVISYSPLIFSNYFYHDDYIYFTGSYQNLFEYTLSQGRPATGLFWDLFSFTTYNKSFIPRIVSLVAILLLFFLTFIWMKENRYGLLSSLLISFIIALSIPVINMLGYITMFIFPWGLLFSSFSVILFLNSFNKFHDKNIFTASWLLMLSIISIILSLIIYQPSSTMGLALLILVLINPSPKKLCFTVFYYIIFILSVGSYYLSNRLIWSFFGITPVFRTSVVSFGEIIKKLHWFITQVLPQAVRYTLFPLFQTSLFVEKYNISSLDYHNIIFRQYLDIVLISVIFLLIFINVLLCRSKYFNIGFRFLFIFCFLSIMPLSYFFYMVITESVFLSFYAVGIVSIISILIFDLFISAARYISTAFQIPKIVFYYGLIVFMTILSINSHSFISQVWVEENQRPYNVIREEFQNIHDRIKYIYVIGDISRTDVDIYKIRAVEMALIEADISRDSLKIFASDSETIINKISYETYSEIVEKLSFEELTLFDQFYFNNPWGFYQLRKGKLTSNDLSVLENLLNNTRLLPRSDNKSITIDLR